MVIGESNATKTLDPAVLNGTGKARKAATYQEAGQDITVVSEREFLDLLKMGVPPIPVEPVRTELAPSPVSGALPKLVAVLNAAWKLLRGK